MTDAMKDRTRTTHETPASAGTPPTGIDLFAFSVVLVANANNPSIINQDFLLNNGIITDEQPLKRSSPHLDSSLFTGSIRRWPKCESRSKSSDS